MRRGRQRARRRARPGARGQLPLSRRRCPARVSAAGLAPVVPCAGARPGARPRRRCGSALPRRRLLHLQPVVAGIIAAQVAAGGRGISGRHAMRGLAVSAAAAARRALPAPAPQGVSRCCRSCARRGARRLRSRGGPAALLLHAGPGRPVLPTHHGGGLGGGQLRPAGAARASHGGARRAAAAAAAQLLRAAAGRAAAAILRICCCRSVPGLPQRRRWRHGRSAAGAQRRRRHAADESRSGCSGHRGCDARGKEGRRQRVALDDRGPNQVRHAVHRSPCRSRRLDHSVLRLRGRQWGVLLLLLLLLGVMMVCCRRRRRLGPQRAHRRGRGRRLQLVGRRRAGG